MTRVQFPDAEVTYSGNYVPTPCIFCNAFECVVKLGCLIRVFPTPCGMWCSGITSPFACGGCRVWGMWCSGITSALHAEGPGFEPRRLHLYKSTSVHRVPSECKKTENCEFAKHRVSTEFVQQVPSECKTNPSEFTKHRVFYFIFCLGTWFISGLLNRPFFVRP